ncbi:MAG: N-acetyltransferase family protein [Chloroflexota bacterium]|nr:N-acetyltransferase family protein [Chloroflexota bacterium]
MQIRDATIDDAAAIARIYNQGIEDRIATLETVLRTPEDREQWLAEHTARHPVLVVTDNDEVAGWASLNRFNPRPVYDHVADLSVHVARERRGAGVGTDLLRALEERARNVGYHTLVLAALAHNSARMRLYERCRFRLIGIYEEQGVLDDR